MRFHLEHHGGELTSARRMIDCRPGLEDLVEMMIDVDRLEMTFDEEDLQDGLMTDDRPLSAKGIGREIAGMGIGDAREEITGIEVIEMETGMEMVKMVIVAAVVAVADIGNREIVSEIGMMIVRRLGEVTRDQGVGVRPGIGVDHLPFIDALHHHPLVEDHLLPSAGTDL